MKYNKANICTEKRCIIGEGPIWNSFEHRLYFTNGFGGVNMDNFIITTASYGIDIEADRNAGFTIVMETEGRGRRPY